MSDRYTRNTLGAALVLLVLAIGLTGAALARGAVSGHGKVAAFASLATNLKRSNTGAGQRIYARKLP